MKRTLSLLLLLLGISTFAQTPYETADSLVDTDRLGNAFKAVNILKEQEKSVDYYVIMAKALVVRRRPNIAHQMADSALTLFEDEARAYWVKGYLLISYGKNEEAIPFLSKSIELKDNGEARYWRGIAYTNLKLEDQALEDYRSAVQMNYASPGLYNNLGIVLLRNEMPHESEEVFTMTIKRFPNYGSGYSARASTRIFLGKLDSACLDIQRAHALGYLQTPTMPDSICSASANSKMMYAFRFASLANLQSTCLNLFERIPDKSKLDISDSLSYAYALLISEQYAKAEEIFLAIEPNLGGYPDTLRHIHYNDMSELYIRLDRFEKVVEYNNKFMAYFGDAHIPLNNRAIGYLNLGENEKALADINRAIELVPNYVIGLVTRAQVFIQMEDYESALTDLNLALRIDPQKGRAYAMRAIAKKSMGIPDYCTDAEIAKSLGMTDFVLEGCE